MMSEGCLRKYKTRRSLVKKALSTFSVYSKMKNNFLGRPILLSITVYSYDRWEQNCIGTYMQNSPIHACTGKFYYNLEMAALIHALSIYFILILSF